MGRERVTAEESVLVLCFHYNMQLFQNGRCLVLPCLMSRRRKIAAEKEISGMQIHLQIRIREKAAFGGLCH